MAAANHQTAAQSEHHLQSKRPLAGEMDDSLYNRRALRAGELSQGADSRGMPATCPNRRVTADSHGPSRAACKQATGHSIDR